MAKKYIILNTSELDSLDFNELLNTSEDHVRKSTDGAKAIVSYEGTTPSGLSGKTEYTNNELLVIVNDINGEWYTAPGF
tara:strand:+ start:428 stop:664 length:237 start_codon:yes stop_codon:yes gene_type:complete